MTQVEDCPPHFGQDELDHEAREKIYEKIRKTYGIEKSWPLRQVLDTEIVENYFIDDCLVAREPCVIAGASKSLKTTIAVSMLLSLASGRPFLNRFAVSEPKRVFFASAESGKATTKKTIIAMANAMGNEFDPFDLNALADRDMVEIAWWVPKISSAEMLDYFTYLVDEHQSEIVIIDPLYQSLDDQQSSMVLNGQQLATLTRHVLSRGATPIMLDHVKRSSTNAKEHLPLDLEDISGAGKAEYFRQWLLLSRRSKFTPGKPHELWLSIGGSAGHASQWSLDIVERNLNPREREYEIATKSRHDHETESQQARKADSKSKAEQKAEVTEARLMRKADEVIAKIYKGDRTLSLTQSDIEARTGVTGKEVKRVVGMLVTDGRLKLVPKSCQKSNVKYDGYMLSDGLGVFGSDEE